MIHGLARSVSPSTFQPLPPQSLPSTTFPQSLPSNTSHHLESNSKIIMPCDNHNCQGDHFHDDCPDPFVCSGCGSHKHCWSDCPEICLVCGTRRHTAQYCIDFKPGRRGKPSVMFPAYPKPCPYLKSYKTNQVEIDAGRSKRFGPLPQSPPRTPSPIPVVNLPAARPISNRLRPTAPIFYPRRAENGPFMPAPVPAFSPPLWPTDPIFYPHRAGDALSILAPAPALPPPLWSTDPNFHPHRAGDALSMPAPMPAFPPGLWPTDPNFHPRRAEDAPSMPAPVPAFPPGLHLWLTDPNLYPHRAGDEPSMPAPMPAFRPHFQSAAAPPATLPPMPTDYPLAEIQPNMRPDVDAAWMRAYWEKRSARREMELDY